jgi:hypothetical protein
MNLMRKKLLKSVNRNNLNPCSKLSAIIAEKDKRIIRANDLHLI